MTEYLTCSECERVIVGCLDTLDGRPICRTCIRDRIAEEGGPDDPIAVLELSVRARNCLDTAGVRTVRQLASMSRAEVLNIKNLGKTSLCEIAAKMAERGLELI